MVKNAENSLIAHTLKIQATREKHIKRPGRQYKQNISHRRDDRRMPPDGTLIKTNNGSATFGGVTKYEVSTNDYKINVNRRKVKIIAKNATIDLRNFRGILPEKYRNVKFEKKERIWGMELVREEY